MIVHLRHLRRFRELTPRERGELVVAWLASVPLALLLWTLGTRRLLLLVERLVRPARRRAADPREVSRLRWLVAAAARRSPLPRNCLRESILLVALLRRRGIDARLRIGVRKDQDGLSAHAWAEVDGAPVGEPGIDHRQFREFPQPLLPQAPAR